MFARYVTDKELTFLIYKELLQIEEKKKAKNPIEKWQRLRQFTHKKIDEKIILKHMKVFSTLLTMRAKCIIICTYEILETP